MSLTDIEHEILAEGEKLRARIHADALAIRKSHLLDALAKLDEEIAALTGSGSAETAAEQPVKAPAPKKTADTKAAAAKA